MVSLMASFHFDGLAGVAGLIGLAGLAGAAVRGPTSLGAMNLLILQIF